MTTTRFAPSPTGRLHLGHAWSALFGAALSQQKGNGTFLVRIEDIDAGRCRPEFMDGIFEDLEWLGLDWPKPVRRQSDCFPAYTNAIHTLQAMGVLYPCFCTRKDIQAEVEQSGAAPHGPEGMIYPGTCSHLNVQECQDRIASGEPYALRLDMQKAASHVRHALTWRDIYQGEQAISLTALSENLGDVVLARKGLPASYHLCVTLDDHLQGVNLVTRGQDLFYASPLHRLLQHLLNLNTPEWAHHPLLLDAEGKRFAKRNNSVTLHFLRESGKTRDDIIEMVWNGLPEHGPWRRLLIDL